MQNLSLFLTVSIFAISAFALTQTHARIPVVAAGVAAQIFDAQGKCKRGFVWDASARKCVRTRSGGPRGSF